MSEDLRAALRTHAVELSQRVLDRMYENAFWMARYGERGRRFANEDSLYHVQYLDQALAAGDAAVFEKYAQWLRSILVSRGMCSEHLAENFRLLAGEISARNLPSHEAAREILDRGVRALAYTDGSASELEARRAALLAEVARSPGAASMREDDRRYLVSYLIDAAAQNNRAAFDTFAGRCSADAVQALQQAAMFPPAPAV